MSLSLSSAGSAATSSTHRSLIDRRLQREPTGEPPAKRQKRSRWFRDCGCWSSETRSMICDSCIHLQASHSGTGSAVQAQRLCGISAKRELMVDTNLIKERLLWLSARVCLTCNVAHPCNLRPSGASGAEAVKRLVQRLGDWIVSPS